MASANPAKQRFNPTLFERLLDAVPKERDEPAPLRQWTLAELKESVARDVEVLLNSRAGLREADFAGLPEAGRSIVSFGMSDFVGLSLANPADRSYICRALERAIEVHEPRLRGVRVGLEVGKESVNRLRFSISATLLVHPIREPVSFDALLQPTTLHYSVESGR